MVTIEIPYVRSVERVRGKNAYTYRRQVPADIRKALRCKNWIKTWRYGTLVSVVEIEARQLAATHDAKIARARGQTTADMIQATEAEVQKLLKEDKREAYETLAWAHAEGFNDEQSKIWINAMQNQGIYKPPGLSLTEALKQDAEKYGGNRDARPFTYAVKSFVKAVEDKDITAITRADVRTWITSQSELNPATIERRLGTLRAMVNRAYLDMDHDGRNPFEKHKISGGTRAVEQRLPLNRAMLDKLDSFLATSKHLGHETRNVMNIMRNTSGGPAEIGGLALADVILEADIPYIWIRPNNIRQRLKTGDVRDRQIPLIGIALEAAQDAVQRTQARSNGKSPDIVPLFTSYRKDRGADSLSAKLNKAIRSAGIPKSRRLTAYSLRHTLGNVAIVTDDTGQCVFSCKSTAYRSEGIDPFFLCAYLNSAVGQAYFRRLPRGHVQTGLNLPDLQGIPVPRLSSAAESDIGEMVRRRTNTYESLKTPTPRRKHCWNRRWGWTSWT